MGNVSHVDVLCSGGARRSDEHFWTVECAGRSRCSELEPFRCFGDCACVCCVVDIQLGTRDFESPRNLAESASKRCDRSDGHSKWFVFSGFPQKHWAVTFAKKRRL